MTSNKSRRQFLLSSGALVLGSTGLRSSHGRAQSVDNSHRALFLNDPNSEESYWGAVRRLFSFDDSVVPMNAANLCPSFSAVTEFINQRTLDIDRDCSLDNRSKFYELHEQSRKLIAEQLNVGADEVALVRNTSEANNIVNNGIQLDAGDEILIWDQNHPTNNIAWEVRAARFNLEVNRVTTPKDPLGAEELVRAFTSQFTSKTKVLALTHVSNLTGVKLPIAEITAAAHDRGIYVHLDGAQVWGALDLDLKALGVDSFSASSHKWYMGPKEVGLLYVNASNKKRIWPGVISSSWGIGMESSLKGARKFESLGQRNDAALAALGVAAKIHNTIGPKKIENRIISLAQRLKSGISAAGLKLVSPMDPELSLGVCIAEIPQRERANTSYLSSEGRSVTIYKRLYSEFGISGAPVNGIRLCPTIYNTEEHIDRAIAGLKTVMV